MRPIFGLGYFVVTLNSLQIFNTVKILDVRIERVLEVIFPLAYAEII